MFVSWSVLGIRSYLKEEKSQSLGRSQENELQDTFFLFILTVKFNYKFISFDAFVYILHIEKWNKIF